MKGLVNFFLIYPMSDEQQLGEMGIFNTDGREHLQVREDTFYHGTDSLSLEVLRRRLCPLHSG